MGRLKADKGVQPETPGLVRRECPVSHIAGPRAYRLQALCVWGADVGLKEHLAGAEGPR